MTTLSFFVLGKPVGQGSKTIGRAGPKTWLREDNPATKPWRAKIADAAGKAMSGAPLFQGPLLVIVTFGFPPTKAMYSSKGVLLPHAPKWKTSKPDVDKLERALFDALKNVAWRDDAQVVRVYAEKVYCDPPMTQVRVIDGI